MIVVVLVQTGFSVLTRPTAGNSSCERSMREVMSKIYAD